MYSPQEAASALCYEMREQDCAYCQEELIRAALETAYKAGSKEYLDKYTVTLQKLTALQRDFEDWKRIWEVEDVKARLDTYTEGYRQRAEALMDAQDKALRFDRLKLDYDTCTQTVERSAQRIRELEQANREMLRDYTDGVEQKSYWQRRAEIAEGMIVQIIMVIFPQQFPSTTDDEDMDDVPF